MKQRLFLAIMDLIKYGCVLLRTASFLKIHNGVALFEDLLLSMLLGYDGIST